MPVVWAVCQQASRNPSAWTCTKLSRIQACEMTGIFMNKPLDDLSPMPFGKYKGSPMQDVPASYLYWLWASGKEHENDPVTDYIRANLSALKQEDPDKIW